MKVSVRLFSAVKAAQGMQMSVSQSVSTGCPQIRVNGYVCVNCENYF